MRKVRPIDSLLTPVKQEILSATYGQPEKWWYLSELAHRAGKSPSSLQRELSTFAANGLLQIRRDRGRVYFRAASDSPLFGPLRDLLNKAIGPINAIREAIEPLRSKIECAFVYGSVARNEERADSDVDLLFVGQTGLASLVKVLKPLEREFEREINSRSYSRTEFFSKIKNGNHFLTSVLQEPKIFLIGNDDDVRRLVSKPLD